MRKIGIFGGTFNPIHKGHIHMARSFLEYLKLDKILIIPTHVPVHKVSQDLIPGKQRLDMCRIAVRNDPDFEVSAIEVESEEKSYTYTTVKKLRQTYPSAEFYLIMGSDMFLSFSTWYRYEDILKEVTLCAAARKDKQYKELMECARKMERMGGKCVVLDLDVVDISSTQLREGISRHEDMSQYLDAAVEEYIREKGLYQSVGSIGK